MPAGAVVVAAERVADDDRVVPEGVKLPVGFIAQCEAGNGLPALEREGAAVEEVARDHDPDVVWRTVAPRGLGGRRYINVVGHGRGSKPPPRPGGKKGAGL